MVIIDDVSDFLQNSIFRLTNQSGMKVPFISEWVFRLVGICTNLFQFQIFLPAFAEPLTERFHKDFHRFATLPIMLNGQTKSPQPIYMAESLWFAHYYNQKISFSISTQAGLSSPFDSRLSKQSSISNPITHIGTLNRLAFSLIILIKLS